MITLKNGNGCHACNYESKNRNDTTSIDLIRTNSNIGVSIWLCNSCLIELYQKIKKQLIENSLLKVEENQGEKTMKISKIEEDGITFDNGYILKGFHQSDCCENVYADFKGMQVMTIIGGNSINSDILEFDTDLLSCIKQVEGLGFIIEDRNGIRLFVSCYNQQNGYYSSSLELIFHHDGIESKLDISSCCKDEIY